MRKRQSGSEKVKRGRGRGPGTVQAEEKKRGVRKGETYPKEHKTVILRTSKAKRDLGPGYTVKTKILES
ncbi:MAG: hypothetical protein Q7T55_00235 [Solirubrobacteraceae bacterium]|nr:hypothetical protein [Solirubrobacteraceae bacterium]